MQRKREQGRLKQHAACKRKLKQQKNEETDKPLHRQDRVCTERAVEAEEWSSLGTHSTVLQAIDRFSCTMIKQKRLRTSIASRNQAEQKQQRVPNQALQAEKTSTTKPV